MKEFRKNLDPDKMLNRSVFINQYILRAQKTYPYAIKNIPRKELKEALHDVIEVAFKNGFDERGATRYYLDLGIILGYDFIHNPLYSWILEAIENRGHLSQLELSMRLHQLVEDYLHDINEDSSHWKRVKNRLLTVIKDKATFGFTYYVNGIESYITEQLQQIHPKKHEKLSIDQLQKLIALGQYKAQEIYDVKSSPDIAFIVLLMFIFGHDLHQDPFLTWANPQHMNQYGLSTMMHLEQGALTTIDALIHHQQKLEGVIL